MIDPKFFAPTEYQQGQVNFKDVANANIFSATKVIMIFSCLILTFSFAKEKNVLRIDDLKKSQLIDSSTDKVEENEKSYKTEEIEKSYNIDLSNFNKIELNKKEIQYKNNPILLSSIDNSILRQQLINPLSTNFNQIKLNMTEIYIINQTLKSMTKELIIIN